MYRSRYRRIKSGADRNKINKYIYITCINIGMILNLSIYKIKYVYMLHKIKYVYMYAWICMYIFKNAYIYRHMYIYVYMYIYYGYI